MLNRPQIRPIPVQIDFTFGPGPGIAFSVFGRTRIQLCDTGVYNSTKSQDYSVTLLHNSLLNISLTNINCLISNYFRCNWSFVFDPAGRLCYYWSMVVSFAFLYNFWVIIFRFSFAEITLDTLLIWFCLDYLMDLIYLLDIVFHFRTGYLEDGVLQTDSTKLRQHYMNSTTFYVDCLCLLPLDFLYLSLGFKSILRIFR